MFRVFSLDVDGEWKPTGRCYNDVSEAQEDYGEEHVRPIGDKGTVFALHADERDNGVLEAIMIAE
jgi:hypothetical protein